MGLGGGHKGKYRVAKQWNKCEMIQVRTGLWKMPRNIKTDMFPKCLEGAIAACEDTERRVENLSQ